jgi:hypothetical protein
MSSEEKATTSVLFIGMRTRFAPPLHLAVDAGQTRRNPVETPTIWLLRTWEINRISTSADFLIASRHHARYSRRLPPPEGGSSLAGERR